MSEIGASFRDVQGFLVDHVEYAFRALDSLLKGERPSYILLGGVVFVLILQRCISFLTRSRRVWQDKGRHGKVKYLTLEKEENIIIGGFTAGWKQVISSFVVDLPFIRSIVQAEKDKIVEKLRKDMKKQRQGQQSQNIPSEFLTLPATGFSKNAVWKFAQEKQRMGYVIYREGDSKASGAIYLGDKKLEDVLNQVYSQFSLSNPMHSDMFPSVRQMEAEVIQMTASLVGGGEHGAEPNVCGSMTSGGTESILTAVKASRDYMMARHGIRAPEMIVGKSAHAAFVKAAEYFRIRLVKAPLDKKHRLTGKSVSRYINKNTVLVVASAPGFPHGILDDVTGIGKICEKKKIPLHVDACLGGFVLPFLRNLDLHTVPFDISFDFSVPGVTSMSLDTHKFGCAHKGTSVVLFKSPERRKYQYTSITDWTGGLYISPGFAGSRSGALISTAWTALLYHGLDGYIRNARRMMNCAEILKHAVQNDIPELEIVGDPVMCVVAFKSVTKDLNIYIVNDLMSDKGWHLNALQDPQAVHMCFTPAHSENIARELARDLKDCVEQAKKKSPKDSDGLAPLYGMAAKVPDRRIVGDFLIAYQDILLEP